MLFEFAKIGRARYISHLDLQRFMQRALRRTTLPVSYTKGFNPHAQMAFASALAMGQESRCELLDVKMECAVGEAEAYSRMATALPVDMPLLRVRQVLDTHPSLMALLTAAEYLIELAGPGTDDFEHAVSAFMARSSHIAMRRTKSGEKPTDIRQLALEMEVERGMSDATQLAGGTHCVEANSTPQNCDKHLSLRARLMLTEHATLKPELLLSELHKLSNSNAPPPVSKITRVRLLASESGGLTDLFDYDRAF